MSFADIMQQAVEQQQQGNREKVEFPNSKLKNKELYFSNDTNPSTLLVRILPPAVLGQNYNVQTRELFLQTRNRNGKDLKLSATFSGFPNVEDPLENALVTWQSQNRVPNSYNSAAKPGTKHLMNVVEVVLNPQTGRYEEARDQYGNLVVRMLKLSYTACASLNAKIVNPLYSPVFPAGTPDEVAQYSFLSPAQAFPVQITRTKPAPGAKGITTYDCSVLANIPLEPLPQGWENTLEDLQYQATPSYVYNSEYIDYFIKVVNGEEPVNDNQQGGVQPPVQQPYQQQAPAFTQPPVQQAVNQLPTNPAPQYQQPATQPAQQYQQPAVAPVQQPYQQPVAQQAPYQQPPVQQPAAQQYQQPAPVQQQAAQQYQQAPLPEEPPVVSDMNLPTDFVGAPSGLPSEPDPHAVTQQPVGPVQPVAATQPAPPTQMTPPPAPNTQMPPAPTDADLPSVDDLIAQMT